MGKNPEKVFIWRKEKERGNHTRERKISYIIKLYTLRIDWIIVFGFSSEIIKIKWFYKFAILNQVI